VAPRAQVWGANGNKKRLGIFVNVIAEGMKHWVRSSIASNTIETDHLVCDARAIVCTRVTCAA
jgi:hypothetical protein